MLFDEDYEAIYKVVLVGDSGVGKTNILSRYIKGQFRLNTRSTVGVEFGTKIIKTESIVIKAQIWDTAGQERYRSLTNTYFKGSNGAFLVYDITQRKSFEGIERWYNEMKNTTDMKTSIILVGNKCDLDQQREITQKEGEAKAKALGMPFFETSALSNILIDDAFQNLVEDIVLKNHISNERIDAIKGKEDEESVDRNGADLIHLNHKIPLKKKKMCCK